VNAETHQLIKETVREAIEQYRAYPPEHEQWVTLAMKREARRETLYRAVTEKSLAGLVWSAMAGIGTAAYYYFRDHWR